jgi:drug/metabolite transporter (DMT)-like permease
MADDARAERLRGIGLLCTGLIFFTLLDVMAKFASHSVPIIEIVWVRFLGQTALVIAILRPWRDFSLYRTNRPGLQVIRGLGLFGSTLFNFLALHTLRLDQTATISLASVFVIAGLAVPMLGEYVGPRRWAAIVVGFVGVLVVLRPLGGGFDPTMLYSIASMLSYSIYNLLTRKLAPFETTRSLLLYSGLLPTVLLTPMALPVAVWPSETIVVLAVAGTAICGAIGHAFVISALRLAPASLLAPFNYIQLVLMTAAGLIFFGDLPDRYTIAGAAIIVASGLYILYRERVHGDR